MTIACPRCGFAFETLAITNTRCRRCKTVVGIASGPARQSRRLAEPAPDEPSAALAGGSLLLVAAGVILAFYVVPSIVRFIRSCRAAAEAPALDGADAGADPPHVATGGPLAATAAHKGGNGGVNGSALPVRTDETEG